MPSLANKCFTERVETFSHICLQDRDGILNRVICRVNISIFKFATGIRIQLELFIDVTFVAQRNLVGHRFYRLTNSVRGTLWSFVVHQQEANLTNLGSSGSWTNLVLYSDTLRAESVGCRYGLD